MTPAPVLRFETFELHPVERRLLVRGEPVDVGSRAFDLLRVLAEQGGAMVTKDQLLDRVWPDVVVAENNLHVQVSALRKLLGTQAIGTVVGRGYRLAVRRLAGDAAAAATAGDAAGTRLPRRPAEMFGRDDELAALGTLLRAHRLVTVVGPGGVGKSLLADSAVRAQLAGPVQDVRWVDLHALADAGPMPRAIAQALARAEPPQANLPELVRALRGAGVTLVLDGAEHLLDAVAQFACAVLDDAPGVRLLVTSQAPLQLDGERVLRLDPLAVPPTGLRAEEAAGQAAIRLFASEAQAADQRFALSDANVESVAAVCRQLDGLPLAIRLAAQRAHVLGLPTLRAHLPGHLHVLRNTSRGVPARQATLTAAFDWSVRMLDDTARAVLRRLSACDGSFTLERATQLASGPDLDAWTVVEALARLVDCSLVWLDAQDTGSYRLLAGTRRFAAAQNDSEATSHRARTEAGDQIDSAGATAIPPLRFHPTDEDHHANRPHLSHLPRTAGAGDAAPVPPFVRAPVLR